LIISFIADLIAGSVYP